jgi:hypothetical protein
LGSVLHNLFQNNNYHFFQGILLLTINYLVYAGIVLGRYRFPSNSILYLAWYGSLTLKVCYRSSCFFSIHLFPNLGSASASAVISQYTWQCKGSLAYVHLQTVAN